MPPRVRYRRHRKHFERVLRLHRPRDLIKPAAHELEPDVLHDADGDDGVEGMVERLGHVPVIEDMHGYHVFQSRCTDILVDGDFLTVGDGERVYGGAVCARSL